jgi:tellurite resistance protein TerC
VLSKLARKVLIAIAGTVVLLIGIIMIFLPGPAILVIPAGLAILATEFEWAQRLLHRMRERIKTWREKRKRPKPGTAPR